MEIKTNILIGEVAGIYPVYLNGELADNIEKIVVSISKDLTVNHYSFIVGKELYKINNIVILALNGTVLRFSSITKKYCKTRRGNPKVSHLIKSRKFNNITDKEGNNINFESPGVVFNYYRVIEHIKSIYSINKPILVEDIKMFLVSRKINHHNYENKGNIFTRTVNKILKTILWKKN